MLRSPVVAPETTADVSTAFLLVVLDRYLAHLPEKERKRFLKDCSEAFRWHAENGAIPRLRETPTGAHGRRVMQEAFELWNASMVFLERPR